MADDEWRIGREAGPLSFFDAIFRAPGEPQASLSPSHQIDGVMGNRAVATSAPATRRGIAPAAS